MSTRKTGQVFSNVDVLIQGYYFPGEGAGKACSTVSLVRCPGLNIVVDPGSVPRAGMLPEALEKYGLTTGDIDILFLTHSHVDHCRFAGLFTRAAVLDEQGWWQGDAWQEKPPGFEDFQVLHTPGHSEDSITLLVSTVHGKVALCGDVFYHEDGPLVDPFAQDAERLGQSRQELLNRADFIVPGHGPMFEVKK